MSTTEFKTAEPKGNRCQKCGELYEWSGAGWQCLTCTPVATRAQQQRSEVFQFSEEAMAGVHYRRTYSVVQFEETYNGTAEGVTTTVPNLKKAKGLLKRDGVLKVDMKYTQLTNPAELLRTIVEEAGFFVTGMRLENNTVCLQAMPEIKVEKVIVYGPPGVGDVIWSLNKIKDIRRREAPCRIIYTTCSNAFEGARSFDLLNNCGLIDGCDVEELPLPRGEVCPDISRPVYNLFANPHVDAGKPLGEWLPEYECDFDIDFHLPEAAEKQVHARMRGMKYATVYFASNAWNQECTAGQAWTPKEWAATCIFLNSIGIKPIVLGKGWDKTYVDRVAEEIILAGEVPGKVWINMCDKTPLLLALAFMKNAEITVGSGSSGLTITAAYLGYNVLTFWPKPGVLPVEPFLCSLIKDGFSTKWMPPDVMALGKYTALHFGEYTVDDVKQNIMRMVGK